MQFLILVFAAILDLSPISLSPSRIALGSI